MKICIFGAGAIGGYMGVAVGARGRGREFHCARPAPRRDAGRTACACKSDGEEHTVNGALHDRPARTRAAGLRDRHVQGALGAGRRRRDAAAARHAIRQSSPPSTAIPYWYFYQHGGDFAGTTLHSIDPGRQAMERARPGTRDRLRAVSRRGNRRAGRDQTRVRQEIPDRRAERRNARRDLQRSTRSWRPPTSKRRSATTSATKSG